MRGAAKPASACVLILFFAMTLAEAVASSTSPESLAHVDHALRAFPGTPDGAGLLDTAMAEGRVAVLHAGFAASDLQNLDNMRRHVGHVLHAVDPTRIESGPGAGYGGRKAAEDAARHIELAAQADGASDAVKTHAVHIATSARNAAARMERVADLAAEVQTMETAEDAAPLVEEIRDLAEQAVSGLDADGDGRISWREGEGGLDTAALHGGFLMQAEGIE
jgi:hypothetical protein